MAHFITSKNGGTITTFEDWFASLPEGSEKEEINRVTLLQKANWDAGNEYDPLPEFVPIYQRFLDECNLEYLATRE